MHCKINISPFSKRIIYGELFDVNFEATSKARKIELACWLELAFLAM